MMSFSRPFAYNSGAPISGTTQLGDLIVGDVDVDYSSDYGGVKWWGGPDEDLRWIIGNARPSGQPVPPGVVGTARVGFWGSKPIGVKTNETFLNLADYVGSKNGQPPFADASAANTWLNSNGYYTNYIIPSPTPTETTLPLTPTPTSTPSFINCDLFTFIGNNATTTSNSAINDGTGGWDSSAYSFETFTGPVSVTFQTSASGNTLMGGFSYNPTANLGNTYVDTSYGIYTYGTDQIEIYENGGQVAVINLVSVVSSSDVWKVDYNGTDVKYYRNATLLYTSTNAVTQPLHVFFPLLTPNQGAVNICVIGTLSPTPTPTPTETPLPLTPTPSVTTTISQTPSVTPTLTPTPSVTPQPVTGYSFNLVALPYNFPSSGNTIMNGPGGATSGTTDPNVLATGSRGIYWNSIDSDGVDRTDYFSGFTGQSVTITMSQTGSTAIYSGDTNSLKTWTAATSNGFVFGAGIGVPPPPSTPSGTAILIQSASTQWTLGLPVYISAVVNGLVTPTPTPTETTLPLTPTPTETTLPLTPTPTETTLPLTPTPTETTLPLTPTLTETPLPLTPTLTETPTNTPTPTVTQTPTPTGTPSLGSVVNMTLLEVGGDVVLSGAGTMNTTSLGSTSPFVRFSGVVPQASQFGCGLAGPGPFNCVIFTGGTITEPANFGTGNQTLGSSGTGDFFGIGFANSTRRLFVPSGYTSGSFISGTTTFNSTTLATLGATPGTYTWSWGSGPTASSIVMTVGTGSVTPTPTETIGIPTPTPTPTETIGIPTPTPTPTVTNTPTITSTPTNTPTPTTSGASGNFNISVSQVGPDVVWSGSGSFNLTSLTLNQNIPGVTGGFNRAFAQFIVGPTSPSPATTYSGSSFTTFPTSFGSTPGGLSPSSSSGSLFGVVQTSGTGGPREVAVPQGYVSGTVISGSMTYNSQTIAGMGLSGGTYTWAWGSGGSASSIVMTITP